jgi:uncharacterized membrane protein YfcA
MAADFSQLLVLLAVFGGALVSGFCGFAFSAVAGAVLLHLMPPREAVPLMMSCSVLVQGVCLYQLRRQIEWRGSGFLILGGLLGLPPALYALLNTDQTALRIGFGCFLAAYAGYMLLSPAARRFAGPGGPWRMAAVGFLGGLVGGVTAMPGAVATVWCDMRGIPKDRQRGLVQPYIVVLQVAALAFLAVRGELPESLAGELALTLVPLGAGALGGLALFRRVSDKLFRRALLSVLLLCGLTYVF